MNKTTLQNLEIVRCAVASITRLFEKKKHRITDRETYEKTDSLLNAIEKSLIARVAAKSLTLNESITIEHIIHDLHNLERTVKRFDDKVSGSVRNKLIQLFASLEKL